MPELTEVDKSAPVEAKPEKPEQSAESSTDSDSDEEIPELEDAGTASAGATAFPGASATGLPVDMVSKAKQSRGEKKARKIMSKLGLKPVSTAFVFVYTFEFSQNNNFLDELINKLIFIILK